ncbi:hypothetical protein TTHERM_00101240 (macronuclear) [Tetrahymena thermophila SB210]|uniref:Uncharacterized protein n=1 Tax=Tetrahymena thermophila (strain SB210) TaxID=312017 RepID=Q234S5_TETTS|nr:hypothetical protein TTHERM_00101240 [Tetrahymena thermophila SB210]EAR91928.1 hypothetical protein TTHERM_00101240 [Tetrahymena thermophila SB210]|eukprot:XP_001012173.1 hypothetical protein TTHERM_00101240 [Tetrahymena thermophila SB210]
MQNLIKKRRRQKHDIGKAKMEKIEVYSKRKTCSSIYFLTQIFNLGGSTSEI